MKRAAEEKKQDEEIVQQRANETLLGKRLYGSGRGEKAQDEKPVSDQTLTPWPDATPI